MDINSNNINGNYAIAEDGTIKRPYNELDTAMLNIIRVGASKDDILAAYKARKKCYQLCKENANRLDYKEYVETLQLDNFPNELKKADYGRRYVKLFWSLIVSSLLGISSFLFGCYWIWEFGTTERLLVQKMENYITVICWGDVFIGVIFIVFAIALCFAIKYIYNKLASTSHTIKGI